jgi:hypothetical protein
MKMKGKIEWLVPQNWQGRKFYQVTVDGRAYDCWSRGIEDKKVGDEIEFDVIEESDGRLSMRFVSQGRGASGVSCS